MKKYLWTISTIILVVLASCQEKAEFTDEQKTAIEKEVKDQNDKQFFALNKMDINAMFEFWSKDQFISVNSGVYYFPTLSAWRDSVTNWFSQRERQQVESIEVRVTALTSELALLTSKENWEAWFKDQTSMKTIHLSTFLWKKEPDGWKVINFHESWAPAK